MRITLGTVVLLALVTMAPSAAGAQSGDPVPTSVAVTFPAEQPYPDRGKVALYEGEADRVGVVFAIPASTVFAHSAIVLQTVGGKQVQVGLRNDLTSGWDRTVNTDTNGYAELRYRTEGTASLLVQSVNPAERVAFQVAFYHGKEMAVHKTLPPPFTKPASNSAVTSSTTSPAAATNASSPVLWVIAGLLGLLVIVGGLILVRMRTSPKESK